MENSFFQLTRLKQIKDSKTKQNVFSGEISFILVRDNWIKLVGPDIYNGRTISWIVCGDGRTYAVDIHPSDLASAGKWSLLTTPSIIGANDQLMPDSSFDSK